MTWVQTGVTSGRADGEIPASFAMLQTASLWSIRFTSHRIHFDTRDVLVLLSMVPVWVAQRFLSHSLEVSEADSVGCNRIQIHEGKLMKLMNKFDHL